VLGGGVLGGSWRGGGRTLARSRTHAPTHTLSDTHAHTLGAQARSTHALAARTGRARWSRVEEGGGEQSRAEQSTAEHGRAGQSRWRADWVAASREMATAPECPEVQETADPSGVRVGLGALVMVLSVGYIVGTAVWWRMRREHPILQRRDFSMIVLSSLGMCIEIIRAGMVAILGQNNISCDWWLVLIAIVMPIAAAPICARAVAVYSRIQLQRQLSTYGDQEVELNLEAFTNLRGMSKLVVVLKAFGRELIMAHKHSKFSNESTVSQVSEVKHRPSIMGPDDGQVRQDADRLRLRFERSVALRIASTTYFRWGFVGAQVFIGVLFIGILLMIPGLPYGNDCFGCTMTIREATILGLQLGFIVFIGLTFLFATRDESDPVGILFEQRFVLSLVGCFVIASSISFYAPLTENSKPLVTEYITSTFLLMIHSVQCTLQVAKTYMTRFSPERIRPLSTELSTRGSFVEAPMMETVMSSPFGLKKFQEYLATEFALENLYFLLAVDRHKQQYEEKEKSHEAQKESALRIYKMFIQDGALLTINIGSSERKNIAAVLSPKPSAPRVKSTKSDGDIEAPVVEDPTDGECFGLLRGVFDNAQREIEEILRRDSFPRFLRSRQYKAFLHGRIRQSVKAPRMQRIPTDIRDALMEGDASDSDSDSDSRSGSFQENSLHRKVSDADSAFEFGSDNDDDIPTPGHSDDNLNAVSAIHNDAPGQSKAAPAASPKEPNSTDLKP